MSRNINRDAAKKATYSMVALMTIVGITIFNPFVGVCILFGIFSILIFGFLWLAVYEIFDV